MNMPWVHLKRWWLAYQKRQRRDFKLEAQLHSLEMASSMGAMFAGNGEAEESDDARIDDLRDKGFPIVVRHTGSE